MLAELRDDNLQLAARMREIHRLCDENGDVASASVIEPSNSHLKLITPTIEIRTVTTPRRKPNADYRTREYLTTTEIEQVIGAAKSNRWGHRDATMILVAYRHGLRVSELTDLRWDQIDFHSATLAVRRVKRGTLAT